VVASSAAVPRELHDPLRDAGEWSGPPVGVGRVGDKGAGAGQEHLNFRGCGEDILTIGLLPVAGSGHSGGEGQQYGTFIRVGKRDNRKKARYVFS
jgi:hypothetical protein